MTDLSDSVASLKRVVARPGTFTSFFPETTDDDLTQTLMDGLASAQLDGMLGDYDMDDDGEVTPDLTRPQTALIVMYGGAILIRAELFNRKTHRRYEASGAVFEEDQATNILRDLLKNLEGRIKAIVQLAVDSGAGAAFHMADAYYIRQVAHYSSSSITDLVYDPVGE